MADGIVVLCAHSGSPRRSWCLGRLLVAALSSGLSFTMRLINKLHSLYSYWLMNRIGDISSVIITVSSSIYYHADNFLEMLHFYFLYWSSTDDIHPSSSASLSLLLPTHPPSVYQSVVHLLTYLLSSCLARLSPFVLYFP